MKIRCVALWHLNNLGEWLILRISLADPGGERDCEQCMAAFLSGRDKLT